MSQKYFDENFKINGHKYRFWILEITVFLAGMGGYLVKLRGNH